MTKVRVGVFAISSDGYGAGPDQTKDEPLGIGGESLHQWIVGTRTFHKMVGKDGGTTGIDDQIVARGMENLGAWILGRNMFGPIRGDWPDDSWKGWWGPNPPYHVPVFVLTHYPRASIEMEGGTTFHFVTDGIQAALKRATAAANGKDIRIGGGTETIRQFLQARLIDEMQISIVPLLLGRGESLFGGLDLGKLGYSVTSRSTSDEVLHVIITKAT
jgi:dihydrofolate reductase